MKFLQISDLHYRNQYPTEKGGYYSIFKKMTLPIEQLKRELERIDMSSISFVAICGDLTEDGEEEDYRALKKYLDEIFDPVPYIVTLGNHDKKIPFYKAWYGNCSMESRYGTVRHFHNLAVIALDNSSEKQGNGRIGKEQCAWLTEQFEEILRREEKAILMMHHPLIFDRNTPIPVVAYSEEFRALIRRFRPEAILCGHTHEHLTGSFEGVLHATCGSMSFYGCQMGNNMVLFRECASMNLWHMEGCCISTEEFSSVVRPVDLGLVRM